MQMVQQGRHSVKPDRAEKLLIMVLSILLFKGGMALMRNLSECMIDRHLACF